MNDTESIDQFVSDETDEWATPPGFVRPLADAVGGFDLDPASGAEHSPVASSTYTKADDGLSSPWYGRVWCNPPYSEMKQWSRKTINESQRDEVDLILFLVKGDSSTEWWQASIGEASYLAMLDGRLSFGDGGAAPFPSHVFVFGEVPDAALDILDRRGAVMDTGDVYRRTEQGKLL